ncbi:MAG: heme exporter protein CcmB [Gammaproteobacteria bacterium]|nr:heme exporter protein CcmB [Gammaproteobacteria bacterium]MCY4182304.1 heme exporter protein CcmB [Gammaproteobacteria bacterium]MCY4268980.1 heme exporter protein CcmB [Gammaproteobacteria bacterium]MCY4297359.1 heme exporter protein CcmB [Gammaproteobacteria bacterium]
MRRGEASPPLSSSRPGASAGAAFLATLKRDLLISLKRRNDILNPFMFFIIVVSLFPIGISPESAMLRQIAAGVVWIAVLLASMLSMDNLYRADYEDGSLEQLLLSSQPLYLLVFAKNIAHWLVSGLPVIVVSPLLAYMLALPAAGYPTLVASLLLGTPVVGLLGSIAVALTVGLGSRGLILAVITVPMSVPVLIFGTLAVQNALAGASPLGYLALLGAMLAAAVSLAPVATAAALRISLN